MKVNVTLVQDAPVFFNKEKTLKKVEAITKQHTATTDLLLFPESFIPGYPRGFDFGTKVGHRSTAGRELYKTYYRNSINFEGPDRLRLEQLAKETETYLIIGATEQVPASGSLYCSMAYFSPTDGLMGIHRKIKPTGQERAIWAEADGSSLVAFDTKIGKIGGLICWENYMPMARQAMYNLGVEIYLAPTADSRGSWISTLQHIALEGRCYVLGCNQYFTRSMYPEEFQPLLADQPEELCSGGSVIVSPLGQIIEGPMDSQSGVLQATLDLDEIIESKLDFDPNGHYTRPDIFKLQVNGLTKIIEESSQGR